MGKHAPIKPCLSSWT